MVEARPNQQALLIPDHILPPLHTSCLVLGGPTCSPLIPVMTQAGRKLKRYSSEALDDYPALCLPRIQRSEKMLAG